MVGLTRCVRCAHTAAYTYQVKLQADVASVFRVSLYEWLSNSSAWRAVPCTVQEKTLTYFCILHLPSRYLKSGYPGNRGIFPNAGHARTINAMMHFLGFPERVVADDRRHNLVSMKRVAVGHIRNFFIKTCLHP